VYEDAVTALRRGDAVVLPTDTVYGIAVATSVPGATARIFEIKERPTTVPLPVLVADEEQALAIAEVDDVASELMARFWPGGLTIVLPRRPSFTADLGGVDDATVGVRVPAHRVAVELARQVGPLATTSANLHGRPTPPTAAEVAAELGPGVAVVIDGGRCDGAPSTVVRVVDGAVDVLREGAVDVSRG